MAHPVECVFRVEGSGPALIMVHGIGASKEIWDGVIADLKDDFTCISFDLRGHGESPLSPEPVFGLEELVADVEHVRERAGVEKAHVIGHSLGGMIAPGYARAYPTRVGALGMLATTAFRTEETKAAIAEMTVALETKGMSALIDMWVRGWFTDEFIENEPEIVEARKRRALSTDPGAFFSVFRLFTQTDMGPWLHEVTAPALVMPAEFDTDCNPTLNAKIVEAMPNAELRVLDGLKHAILLEAPERTAAEVRDYLLAHPF